MENEIRLVLAIFGVMLCAWALVTPGAQIAASFIGGLMWGQYLGYFVAKKYIEREYGK